MSNDKPLRHEDYIAMAAENEQLKREMAAMKTPIPPVVVKGWVKKMTLTTWLYNVGLSVWSWFEEYWLYLLAVGSFLGMILVIAWIGYQDDLDRDEQRSAIQCYSVSRVVGNDGWDVHYGLERHRPTRRSPKGSYWPEVVPDKSFDTPQEALKFLESTNSPVCK